MWFTRFVPLALAASLLAAACSSSHHAATSTSSSTAGAGAGAAATTATTGGGAPTTTVSNAPTSTGSAAGTSHTSLGTTSPTTAATSHASASPATASAASPAKAGTYDESQSGSFSALGKTQPVPPNGTLVVDPASNGSQVWHRYVQQGQSPNNSTLQFTSKGPFLVSTTEQSPQGNVTCTFHPAIPAPTWPPAVGDTFSSAGNCGQFTVDVSGKITGQQNVAVGGTSYSTWVVDTNLTFHGQVSGSGTQEDWYSTDLRIPLKEESTLHGNYGPFSFSSQMTSVVTSIP